MKPFRGFVEFSAERDELIKNFQRTIQQRSIPELSSLIADGDVGTALQAAYSKVVRLKSPADGEFETAPHSMDAWFLGFTEGRLHVELPSWWVGECCGFYMTERGWEAADPYGPPEDEFPLEATECGSGARRGVTARISDNVLELRKNDAIVRVPTDLFGGSGSGFNRRHRMDHIDFIVDGDRVFVGLSQALWNIINVRVICMTYPASEPLWGSQTFRIVDAGGGIPKFQFEILISESKTVLVFASDSIRPSCAIDGFSRKDGTTLFRFSQLFEFPRDIIS
jgi:hypothetical protein